MTLRLDLAADQEERISLMMEEAGIESSAWKKVTDGWFVRIDVPAESQEETRFLQILNRREILHSQVPDEEFWRTLSVGW